MDSRAPSLGLGYTLGDQGDEPATSPNGVAVTQKLGVAVVRTRTLDYLRRRPRGCLRGPGCPSAVAVPVKMTGLGGIP